MAQSAAAGERVRTWRPGSEGWAYAGAGLLAGLFTVAMLQAPQPTLLILGALSVFLLLLWKPSIILFLYPVLLLIFPPFLREASFVGTGVRADQLLLLLGFAVSIGMLIFRRLPLPFNHILLLYVLYSAMFIVSTSFSKFALGYSASTVDIIQNVGVSRTLAILWMGMLLVNSVPRAYLVVRTIVVAGALVIAFGFAQLAGVQWVRLATLALYNRKLELEDWQLFQRITATFDGQSNLAGMFACIFAGLLTGLLLSLPAEQRRLGPWLVLLLLADLAFLLGTGSRGALAGVLLGAAAVILLLGRRSVVIGAVAALAGGAAIGFATSPVLQRRLYEVIEVLTGGRIEIVIGRRPDLWRDALDKYFWPSPLLGSGVQSFYADSAYVTEMAQRGLVGLLLYCLLLAAIGRAGYITWRLARHPLGRALGLCVLTSTLAVAVQGISITVLNGSRTAELYWFLVACMMLFFPGQPRIYGRPESGNDGPDSEVPGPDISGAQLRGVPAPGTAGPAFPGRP